ncbi:MAG: hypothetical protein ABMA25_18255 [Ilumatobacteraceae bacterium]
MNEHDDTERILRTTAAADTAAHRMSVSADDTNAALAAVRARAAAGDTGTIATTETRRRPTRDWRPFAAAAALVALIGGGALALTLRSDDDRTVVPATDPTNSSITATTGVMIAPTTTPSTSPLPTEPALPTTTAEPIGPGLVQPTIPYTCVGENVCTQLIGTADGRIVAYSPADETLTVYDNTGTQEVLRVPLAEPLADAYPSLVTVGPDNVVYVNIATPGASDPISDLIAIPLTGTNAGTVIQRWTGLDGSGDSTLVPQTDGIVTVGCCGFIETRPAADAERYAYVDSKGAPITSTAPMFRLDLAQGGGTLVRIELGSEWAFPLPTEFQAPRDFPRVVATTDGGALALDWIDMLDGGAMYIARFFPPAAGPSQQQVKVYRLDTFQVALMEPAGTVLVVDGDHFTRQQIKDIGLLKHGE